MFCSDCGTELPEEASFCWKCGKRQQSRDEADSQQQTQWEVCEIVYEARTRPFPASVVMSRVTSPQVRLWVQAIGPNGRYTAARSEVWCVSYSPESGPNSKDRKTIRELDQLIQTLVANGWEPTSEKGGGWFSHRFRRRLVAG